MNKLQPNLWANKTQSQAEKVLALMIIKLMKTQPIQNKIKQLLEIDKAILKRETKQIEHRRKDRIMK